MHKPARIILLLLVLAVSGELRGQDFIIRIYGDTLRGKVDESNDRFVYYRTPQTPKGERMVISKKEIRRIIYNAYAEKDLKPWKETEKLRRFEIGVDAGFTGLTGVQVLFDDDFSEYFEGMKNGVYFHGYALYNIDDNLGLGLAYSRVDFSNETEVRIVLDPNRSLTGPMTDDRGIEYIAATLHYRPLQMGWADRLSIIVGLGLLRFDSESTMIFPYRLEGSAIGAHVGAALEISLGGGFYLPIKAGIKGFSVYDLKVSTSPDMPQEISTFLNWTYNSQFGMDLSRFEIGTGIVFAF